MEARVGEAGGAEVVRLHAPSEPAEVWPLLERMFAISNASWKARAGGPLAPHHRRFYEDLAVRFARRGMLDLTIASIGGEDAAFVFALAEQGVFYDGNISFVDRFRDLSPGAWLMQRVLRDLPASGIHTVISHGDHAYKLRWASGFVPLDRLFLFARTPLGTMARMSRFHLPGPLRRRLTPVSELGRALGR
jgi:CelD/BcsL family acetyltransferase involved in cellulose biosynthesis